MMLDAGCLLAGLKKSHQARRLLENRFYGIGLQDFQT